MPDQEALNTALTIVGRNADFDGDAFNSQSYYAHNYAAVREDDRLIAKRVRDFFAKSELASGARGRDIGPGLNIPSVAGDASFLYSDRADRTFGPECSVVG